MSSDVYTLRWTDVASAPRLHPDDRVMVPVLHRRHLPPSIVTRWRDPRQTGVSGGNDGDDNGDVHDNGDDDNYFTDEAMLLCATT